MENTEYYLGLDMGTSSVGWAVTDTHYRLLRAKGKDMWGIREFDRADTSVDRRTHRISRRRRQRELARIGMLKDYFHDAISNVDPYFYQRLDNSKYYVEDKEENVRNKNGIFHDENYSDVDYYNEYPTIFHLRKELIENSQPHDVRLVYLALLNMFKHRGHFLNAGLSQGTDTQSMESAYQQLLMLLETTFIDNQDLVVFPDAPDYRTIEDILSNRDYSRTRKSEELAAFFKIEKKDKTAFAYVKAICGLKVDAKLLFPNIEDEEKKIDICFSEYGFEDKIQEISDAVGEENYQIVEALKAIYDIGSLAGIMKGYSYLSEARVAEYEKHKSDLARLKSVIRKYKTPEEYDKMFRQKEPGSYSAYVNSVNADGQQVFGRRNMKERKREDLYKTIRQLLKDVPQNEDVTYILNEIEKENFLPKQLTASNGIIPNQVHTREMAKILQNAENYLPFLNEKDESGLTVSQRILKLFTFQIPYYVGPVSPKSEQNGGNGWVVRKADGKVLPWNINEKIDLKATSERFIERLIRNCTYISDEKVLPKASLEYEAFCVLNEINNLKIDGEKISVELKQEIYRELFQRGKKVTKKQLVNFLSCKGILKEEAQLSGIDNEINNSLSTYGKFKAIFGEKLEEDECRHMVEDIVRWCTIYGDSKSFLKEQLEERYADKISPENMKRIFGFKFKDWGRLSKEFLELSACDKSTGEKVSLIRTMWDTNYNLMELLHSENYTFDEALKEKQKKGVRLLQEMEPEDLDELYFSAPVKRMVWQTILIIREIEKVLGSSPKRLFIEMTRSDEEKGDKGRKDSRKKQLLDLYKNIKDESRDWKAEIEAADQKGWLRSKKVYLYYTQMGRCMYSGQPIDFEALMNDNIYDIDHIYPRHFVKDDNINNNLVLVDKRLNAHKSDTYPLEASIRFSTANIALWKRLLDVGLILPEKYRRLTGREAFTDEQKAGFIARQLVETSQGTKGVSDILKEMLPETEIVYSKASNVSEFRHQRGLQKSRLVNDFHHAHDAYLNIVVGNVYYVKFTKNPINFIRNEYARDAKTFNYNLSKMFDRDVARGEEIAWKAQTEEGAGTIVTVKKMLAKNTPLLTRFSFEGHGAIANETLYGASKAKKDGYIPLKSSDQRMLDVTKYGGFTSASTAYFFLVEHEVKGKNVRTLETVPVYEKDKIAQEPEELQRYCEQTLGLIHPSVRISRIKIQSLMRINGYNVHISGRTGNRITVRNAVSMCLGQNWIDYIHLLEKYREKQDMDEKITAAENIRLYDILTEKHTKAIYQKRLNPIGKKLIDAREKFEQLTVEKQSLVLLQILQATQIGIAVADLTLIGETANSGVMLFGKNITAFSECKLINQSVTGLFESSVDLLTV